MHKLLKDGIHKIMTSEARAGLTNTPIDEAAVSKAVKLLREAYDEIVRRWTIGYLRGGQPPASNWRWKKNNPIHSERTKKLETGIPKAICLIDPEAKEWWNEVPTSSGLLEQMRGMKSTIDLVHANNAEIELIEVKTTADSASLAAREIVIHGILLLFARNELRKFPAFANNEFLNAAHIKLRVLAPFDYYKRNDYQWMEKHGWMESLLDRGIAALCRELVPKLEMRFRFQTFPEWFAWPRDESRLADALRERHQVW